MISRSRLLFTVASVCHLLVAPQLVTSQLLARNSLQFPSAAGLQAPELVLDFPADQSEQSGGCPSVAHAPSPVKGEETIICAREQEKVHDIFKTNGNVQLNYRDYIIHADSATYNSATGEVDATGHVVIEGGPHDAHIQASRGTYNLR